MKPPTPLAIGGGATRLLQTDLVGEKSFLSMEISNEEPFEDEVIMDIYMPYESPVAIVVAGKKSEPMPYFVAPQGKSKDITMCQDIVADPLGLDNNIAPNLLLLPNGLPKQFGGKSWWTVFGKDAISKITVHVQKEPEHGRVELRSPEFGHWQYYPDKGYEGKDQVIFNIDTPKGSYRLITNLLVGAYDEYLEVPKCIREFNMKKSSLSVDDSTTTWNLNAGLSTLLSNATQSLTGFQNLAGSAVGNTTGSGLYAQITLDADAAGHGWYVDATPLDNTDDFLPTSDAHIWQAKPDNAVKKYLHSPKSGFAQYAPQSKLTYKVSGNQDTVGWVVKTSFMAVGGWGYSSQPL